jgi:predicted transcriptional regulator of viral defense system
MVADRRELRRQLFAAAAQQGGYFTAAQAKAVGYSYQAQAHHITAGNWRRVGRGLFRLAEWAPQPHDDLFRWLLWSRRQGVISHESALSVHGLGEFESPRTHLTVPSHAPSAGRVRARPAAAHRAPRAGLRRSGLRST